MHHRPFLSSLPSEISNIQEPGRTAFSPSIFRRLSQLPSPAWFCVAVVRELYWSGSPFCAFFFLVSVLFSLVSVAIDHCCGGCGWFGTSSLLFLGPYITVGNLYLPQILQEIVTGLKL
ncbi:uncharacterized protein LOC129286255 [Prosopis cineraria]|uniref:uncharacterized protein LOC129286255 n=1 Tax=Prosopis cineraria TaxID=364024 RepID=UPI00240F04FB|nr:uncharacterized protein LOC129286255 [Prosopis cineraria]